MNNEEVVKKLIQDVWNNHNAEAAQNLCDQNIVIHGHHGEIKGLKNFQSFISELCQAFPDLNFAAQDIISVNNKVIVRWIGNGTNKGKFLGNPPTNKKVSYEGIAIYQIQNNKIKESWISADLYGLLKQLGVLHAGVK